MKSILENCQAVGSSAYFGERGEWLIAFAVHRDSDTITRSNFRCAEKALRALLTVKEWQGEFTPIQIERFNHWAVGWVDYLIVDPACTEAVQTAEEMRASVEDYPLLNEEDHSALEQEEADEMWRNCYRPHERAEYIRKHRSQFEFRDFRDLLGCVRGNYFAGYASELIST